MDKQEVPFPPFIIVHVYLSRLEICLICHPLECGKTLNLQKLQCIWLTSRLCLILGQSLMRIVRAQQIAIISEKLFEANLYSSTHPYTLIIFFYRVSGCCMGGFVSPWRLVLYVVGSASSGDYTCWVYLWFL